MKWTVLSDNRTDNSQLQTEHGLSILLDTGHFRILLDTGALYVDGLLFTGCAHNGLENILAACPYPVHTVVGGFHLLDDHESEEELTELTQRLTKSYPNTQFYTSHCTGDKVFAILKNMMEERLHSFCCGMTIIDAG